MSRRIRPIDLARAAVPSAALIAVVLALAACSSGATATWTYAPPPPATPTPVPTTAPSASASATAGPSAAPSGSESAAATTLELTAMNVQYDKTELSAPADQPFAIKFANMDAGIPHNVAIRDSSGADVFTGEIFNGTDTKTYQVKALPAGAYTFVCTVHPNMTGKLTVQ